MDVLLAVIFMVALLGAPYLALAMIIVAALFALYLWSFQPWNR